MLNSSWICAKHEKTPPRPPSIAYTEMRAVGADGHEREKGAWTVRRGCAYCKTCCYLGAEISAHDRQRTRPGHALRVRTCASLRNRPILSLMSGRRKMAPVLGRAWGSFFNRCVIRLRTPELYLDAAEGTSL